MSDANAELRQYRVRYRHEGRPEKLRRYDDRGSAERFIALLHGMPMIPEDLEYVRLESRKVGPWVDEA